MKLLYFLIACLLVACEYANAQPASRTDSITIGKLRFDIQDQEQLIEENARQEQDLLKELARLNQKTLEHQRKISTLNAKISEQQRILAAKEQETISLMRQNQSLRDNLIKRLKAYYVMGRNGFFTIAFSGNTLPELLLTQDAFRSLVTYDQNLFKEYRDSITDIKRITVAKSLEKTMLEKFLADADKEKESLQKTTEEKNDLLIQVQTQKGLYQLALKEMRKAERELAAAINNRGNAPLSQPEGSIVDHKGQLPPPLYGEVVRRFQQADVDGDSTFANGLTIRTPANTEVYSVFSGTVLFAGPMRGYGNMVIIDHHDHYYSVSARLSQIRVQAGKAVAQGKIIGTTDIDSYRAGGEFYFEIRREGVAEDPLDWLSPGNLTINPFDP